MKNLPGLNRNWIKSIFILFFLLSLNVAEANPGDRNIPDSLPDIDAIRESWSVITLTQEDFNKGNVINLWQLIQGRAPGLLISGAGGEPGGAASVIMRRPKAPGKENQTLIVVDGIPLSGLYSQGMRNALNGINPADIESVTLLRDGAAMAIWGVEAGNGVILIQTRRAPEKSPFKLSYQGNVSMGEASNMVSVLDAGEFTSLVRQRYPGDTLLGQHQTYWQNEIYRQAVSHNHYVAADASVLNIPIRASFGYGDYQGVLDTDQMNRINGSLRISPEFFNRSLCFDVMANATTLDNKLAPQAAINAAIMFDPTQPVYDASSPYDGYFIYTNPQTNEPMNIAPRNPVGLINMNKDVDESDILQLRGRMLYKPHFSPNLTIGLNIARQKLDSKRSSLDDFYTLRIGSNSFSSISNHYTEGWVNYWLPLKAIGSNLAITAGLSSQKEYIENILVKSRSHNIPVIIEHDGFEYFNRMKKQFFVNSFKSILDYSLLDKYLITYTYRHDRNSVFSTSNAGTNNHAVSAAWLLHRESFWPMPDAQVKVRGGFALLETFAGFKTMINNSSTGMDPNIHSEKIETYNAGFDFNTLNGGINGGVDLYYSNTSGIIGEIYIPLGTNLNHSIYTNTHGATHRGIESFLNFTLVNTPQLQWRMGTSITYMKNKVLLPDPGYNITYGSIIGGVGNNVMVHAHNNAPGSFFVFANYYDQNGNPIEGLYQDINKDNQLDFDDLEISQSAFPSWYGAIHSSLQWKRWNFSFSGRVMKDNYVYNNTASLNGNYSRLYRPEGPYLANMVKGYYHFNQPNYLSSYYIQDASFFRMDYIGLSYRLKTEFLSRIDVLELTAGLQNAFVLTPYKGLDPEVPSGIDINLYSRPRTFTLGVAMNF